MNLYISVRFCNKKLLLIFVLSIIEGGKVSITDSDNLKELKYPFST